MKLANLEELKQYKRVHMLGIGVTSMSGIAALLKNWGFLVTGSDANPSELVDELLSQNISVTIRHDFDNLRKSNIVVYTAAISQEDPEIVEAKRLNIPLMERAEFLGIITKAFSDSICISGTHGKTTTTSMISMCFIESHKDPSIQIGMERAEFLGIITKAFSDSICISGTHGKTTTTSMISMCFIESHKDPSIQVGALLKAINGNYRVGNSDYFILESCEYVESFLHFHPKTEVVLNIDNDHLDYFKNIDNIKSAFIKYVKLLPSDGLLVLNIDNEYSADLFKYTDARVVTFSLENNKANFVARNISFDKNGFPSFDLYRNNTFFKTFKLSVPGRQNVYNALACIATCYTYGIEKEVIKSALLKYTGAHRRFEYVGMVNGATIYDDYGHHPSEIKAVYAAMAKKEFNRSWVVFQPHTYSRTKNLLNDFAQALSGFNNIIVTDIYAARETNTFGVSSQDLVDLINKVQKHAIYIKDFDEISTYIRDRVMPNDIVLTLGAGTVTKIGPMIINK